MKAVNKRSVLRDCEGHQQGIGGVQGERRGWMANQVRGGGAARAQRGAAVMVMHGMQCCVFTFSGVRAEGLPGTGAVAWI